MAMEKRESVCCDRDGLFDIHQDIFCQQQPPWQSAKPIQRQQCLPRPRSAVGPEDHLISEDRMLPQLLRKYNHPDTVS